MVIMNVGHVLYLSPVMCEESVKAQPKVNSEQVPTRAEARVGSYGLGGWIRTAFSSVSPSRVDRRKETSSIWARRSGPPTKVPLSGAAGMAAGVYRYYFWVVVSLLWPAVSSPGPCSGSRPPGHSPSDHGWLTMNMRWGGQ